MGIIEFERMAAMHWRGSEEEWLGEWLLRAAAGFTGRANSALPLGDPGLPLDDALAAVRRWYRARGLPPMIAVPLPLEGGEARAEGSALRHLDNQLSERAWVTRPGPAFVMTAGLGRLPAPPELADDAEFRVDAVPDDAWLGAYRYRGQPNRSPALRAILVSAPAQAFASIRFGAEPVAIGRLSITGAWAGITAVEVDPRWRRMGLGRLLTLSMCAEAAQRGAAHVFLQVDSGNTAAMNLYEHCGFGYSHRYHYRLAPA